jgi:hypothetical protein
MGPALGATASCRTDWISPQQGQMEGAQKGNGGRALQASFAGNGAVHAEDPLLCDTRRGWGRRGRWGPGTYWTQCSVLRALCTLLPARTGPAELARACSCWVDVGGKRGTGWILAALS